MFLQTSFLTVPKKPKGKSYWRDPEQAGEWVAPLDGGRIWAQALGSVVRDLFLHPILTLPQFALCFVASEFISGELRTTVLFTTHLLVTCSRAGSQANIITWERVENPGSSGSKGGHKWCQALQDLRSQGCIDQWNISPNMEKLYTFFGTFITLLSPSLYLR